MLVYRWLYPYGLVRCDGVGYGAEIGYWVQTGIGCRWPIVLTHGSEAMWAGQVLVQAVSRNTS